MCAYFSAAEKIGCPPCEREKNGVGSWTEVSIVEDGEIGTSQKMLLLNKIARAGAVALL
jgi:hypothetical protein